ncbi:Helix-turn-helix domain-containing protein [Actinacidiphila yanglinensis]|uniref:Helix-turn-helix domain-containing protein n=1 Tax=Actinacidiphila yanglinensis TaxID=310779 RepID=A0A1H6EAG3_9ACTN|nr:helix-turn-helix domain-containing protein [Actinacidiphila yanglinensis]SEG94848.1 Helix-turn-helix domain-containing protein [Actinacidiphila yanglinensis]
MRSHHQPAVPAGLWDQDTVRPALEQRDVAVLFKHFRKYAGASQTAVGALVGLAQSDVSAIERGLRQVQSLEVLTRIADGLGIPPDLMGLAAAGSATAAAGPPIPRTVPTPPPSAARLAEADQEDDVRRRELVAGALGLGAGMIAGTASPAAAQEDGDNPAAAMERALFTPVAAAPAGPRALATALAGARDQFTAARYAALGRALPPLIATAEATRDATSGRAREHAQAMVARAYVLATELAVKQHSEAAWATADRALNAARASGDPHAVSEAARVLAITMRRAGRSSDAVHFLTGTAAALDLGPGSQLTDALAARVCLLMTAAYTAATGGQRSTALDLLGEAEESADRITVTRTGPPAGLFTISASPAECAMYRISSLTVLGTPDDAVPYAARVKPSQLASTERVARYYTDTARMWHQIGDNRRTFSALTAVERTAPEEVRRPALRSLTADLLYAPQSLPGLREFAVRTGAAA